MELSDLLLFPDHLRVTETKFLLYEEDFRCATICNLDKISIHIFGFVFKKIVSL